MTLADAMTIRCATNRDAEQLAALRRLWSEEETGGRVDDADFERRFVQWYAAESSRRTVFVAEVNGQAIGMVNLAVFERMPTPGRPSSRWGYIANVFVQSTHRNQGVGSALLDAVVRNANEIGCVRLVLAPSERSRPFYHRAGFDAATMLVVKLLP
jgi:GNAT superfamily N-acetyltransferase